MLATDKTTKKASNTMAIAVESRDFAWSFSITVF